MENITINPVVWYLITGLITVLLLGIAYFGKRTISSIENAIKNLTDVVSKLNDFMITQNANNLSFKEDFSDLWETVDEHTDKIDTMTLTIQTIKDTHNFIHSKEQKI